MKNPTCHNFEIPSDNGGTIIRISNICCFFFKKKGVRIVHTRACSVVEDLRAKKIRGTNKVIPDTSTLL